MTVRVTPLLPGVALGSPALHFLLYLLFPKMQEQLLRQYILKINLISNVHLPLMIEYPSIIELVRLAGSVFPIKYSCLVSCSI